jgi:CheY-like chemotaxis protein
MPVLDGYAAAREIRRREAGSAHVPIIAVTAHAFEGEREKVLAAGMDDYVVKPVKQAVLREVLERWWPGAGEASSGSTAPAQSGPRSEPPPTENVRRVFLRSVPEQLQELEQAISAADARRLASVAHKLKGGCLAVGATRMASLCAELEKSPGDRAGLRTQLEREFTLVTTRWQAQVSAPPDAGRTG